MQGAALTTDRPLDFLLEGRGFFTVLGFDEEGNEMPLYTRDGAFYLTPDAELVDSAGRYILDSDGEIIVIEGNPSLMRVDSEGRFHFANEEGELTESDISLGIFDFINPSGLLAVGNNLFMESENSGEAELMDTPHVMSGALEGSNVDLALETTKLIRAQRAYQFASRALGVADQMAGLANSIRQ